MSNIKGITQEDSEKIGFVVTSLFCSAINKSELQQWCFKTIQENEISELPSYIFDLCEFNDALAKIFKVIGFVPSWQHDQSDEAALCAIGMQRGAQREEWPIPPEEAQNALKNNEQIKNRFRETFPFLNY